MKQLILKIIILFNAIVLLPMPSAAVLHHYLSSRLNNTEKLFDEISSPSGEYVWDFSNAENNIDYLAKYTIYGDSLICEEIDGFMRWYVKKGDRTHFIKEENRLMSSQPSVEMVSFGFSPNENAYSENKYVAAGKYCRTYDIMKNGTHSSFEPILGKILFSQTDTINAKMTHEQWAFDINDSDEKADTINYCPTFRTDMYRWFADDSKMPVAVFSRLSISDKSSGNTNEIVSAYIADKELLYGIDDLRNEDNDFITSFTANYGHGIVNLQIVTKVSTSVIIEIASDSGIPYGTRVCNLQKGTNNLQLELNTGRPGRYVIALNNGTRKYKQYINCL